MKTNKWFGLVLVALIIAACEEDDILPGHDGAALRIENVSAYTITYLSVTPGAGGMQVYENIAPGDLTDYRPFDFIYSYAYLQAIVDGDTLVLQPIDYVGAEPYDSGAFTYLVQVNGEPEPTSLSVEFRAD